MPSDSNAFNILSALQALQRRHRQNSKATIENDDKALCISLRPPCVLVSMATMREWRRKGGTSLRTLTLELSPQPPAAQPGITGLFIETASLHGPAEAPDPRRLALVHSITQCTCSANTHRSYSTIASNRPAHQNGDKSPHPLSPPCCTNIAQNGQTKNLREGEYICMRDWSWAGFADWIWLRNQGHACLKAHAALSSILCSFGS